MLTCQVDRDLPVTLLEFDGDLRLATVERVRSALTKCMTECPAAVVVDLSDVTISAPIALTIFGAVARRAAEWPPVPLVLVAREPDARAMVQRACRPWRIPVFADRQEAMASAALTPPFLRRARRTFRPALTALAPARAMVLEACGTWGLTEQSLPAELIMSELVSNAVEHARTDFEASLTLRGRLLHLTVADGGASPPRISPVPPTVHQLGGRGLLLVEEFATAWGYVPVGGGKIVWATLRI